MKYNINFLDANMNVVKSAIRYGFASSIKSELMVYGWLPVGGNLWQHETAGHYLSLVIGPELV